MKPTCLVGRLGDVPYWLQFNCMQSGSNPPKFLGNWKESRQGGEDDNF